MLRMTTGVVGFTLALTTLTPAQNGLEVFPGHNSDGGSFYIRGTSVAHDFMVDYSSFEGIGDVTNLQPGPHRCELNGVTLRYLDADHHTQNTFSIVLRSSTNGVPDASAAGLLWSIAQPAALALPTDPVGFTPWIHTVTFGITPATGRKPLPLPCTGGFALGMGLQAAPNWTQPSPPAGIGDGLGPLAADYTPTPPAGGDFPHPSAPDLTWTVVGGVANNAQSLGFTGGLVLGYILRTYTPVLQGGAWHPAGTSNHSSDFGFGAAGIFPHTQLDAGSIPPRGGDGYVLRITDGALVNGGLALVAVSLDKLSDLAIQPIDIGFIGRSYLGLVSLNILVNVPLAGTPAVPAMDTIFTLAPPGIIPVSAVGIDINFQAVTHTGAGDEAMTNLFTVSPF